MGFRNLGPRFGVQGCGSTAQGIGGGVDAVGLGSDRKGRGSPQSSHYPPSSFPRFRVPKLTRGGPGGYVALRLGRDRQRFETNDRLRIPGRGKMIAAVLNAAGEDYGTTDVGASAPHK